MIIKTLTCHNCMNYGASLQAYALQTYIEKIGNECKIIDYMPHGDIDKYSIYRIRKGQRHYGLFKALGPIGFLLALYIHRKQWPFRKRKYAFNSFTEKYLKTTSNRYHNAKELEDNIPKADLYIVGSDQVWNTDMDNGKDPSFYLSFVPNGNRCISYAASFGLSKIGSDWTPFVANHLQHLRWVSVREDTGISIVKSLGINAVRVLDPVFLLSKEQWIDVGKKTISGDYLLLYHLGPVSVIENEICKRIAKERNLKIVALNSKMTISYADVNVNDAGPVEFVEYIRSASYVVSTSFHATAFSVIFNKQFAVCPIIGQNNSSRMKDFLNLFNLSNRLITDTTGNLTDIDYNEVNKMVALEINRSKELLCQQINITK